MGRWEKTKWRQQERSATELICRWKSHQPSGAPEEEWERKEEEGVMMRISGLYGRGEVSDGPL